MTTVALRSVWLGRDRPMAPSTQICVEQRGLPLLEGSPRAHRQHQTQCWMLTAIPKRRLDLLEAPEGHLFLTRRVPASETEMVQRALSNWNSPGVAHWRTVLELAKAQHFEVVDPEAPIVPPRPMGAMRSPVRRILYTVAEAGVAVVASVAFGMDKDRGNRAAAVDQALASRGSRVPLEHLAGRQVCMVEGSDRSRLDQEAEVVGKRAPKPGLTNPQHHLRVVGQVGLAALVVEQHSAGAQADERLARLGQCLELADLFRGQYGGWMVFPVSKSFGRRMGKDKMGGSEN